MSIMDKFDISDIYVRDCKSLYEDNSVMYQHWLF